MPLSTRVNDVDVFKSSERNLVLSHSLHGYLVYSCLLLCCLPDFLMFCDLKCGSEHAQELRAPDAAKFVRQHHTRGHRRSYGQNGPWWQFITVITPVCRANAHLQMIDDTCLLQQDTEFNYRLGETSRSTIRQKAQSPIVISMTEELKSKKHT